MFFLPPFWGGFKGFCMCTSPLVATRLDDGSISFSAPSGAGNRLELPCGQCLHCRISRSRMWSVRCMHEASLHDSNVFLTLTYDNDHLPSNGSLDYSHFQGFMKRLRQYAKRDLGISNIRFYMCGEYGDLNLRPHYHALIFGLDFPDKYLFFKSKSGNSVYRSDSLESLWPFGQSSIGSVTEESAGYVARYVVKKVTGRVNDINPKTGKRFGAVYERVSPDGEVFEVEPEFTRMSLKPGIAQGWFDQFYKDVYPADAVISESGKRMKPPKFYDSKYESLDPDAFEAVKQARIMSALKSAEKFTDERLAAKDAILKAKFKLYERPL